MRPPHLARPTRTGSRALKTPPVYDERATDRPIRLGQIYRQEATVKPAEGRPARTMLESRSRLRMDDASLCSPGRDLWTLVQNVQGRRCLMSRLSRSLRPLGLLAAVTVAALWLGSPSMSGPSRGGPTPEAGGSCGCPKNYRCCLDCSGHLICVRSISQCPECPAP